MGLIQLAANQGPQAYNGVIFYNDKLSLLNKTRIIKMCELWGHSLHQDNPQMQWLLIRFENKYKGFTDTQKAIIKGIEGIRLVKNERSALVVMREDRRI